MRSRFLALCAFALLAACAPPIATPTVGPDGTPLPSIYRIRAGDESAVKFRMLDGVNSLRRAAGVNDVSFDPKLISAAATHSRDMSVQNRPWSFGSDGSSPIDRVARTGYDGVAVGENIRETYESELETLSVWMADEEQPGTREVLLDPRARHMGFDWYQEPNGKIWWTLVMGS